MEDGFSFGIEPGGAVGCQDDGGGKLSYGEGGEQGSWAGLFVLQVFEDGGFVEDSAGGAEFEEVVGEERRDCVGVSAHGWV